MFNPRSNSPFGGSRSNASAYQYQYLPYGMVAAQSGGLVSKVMALMACSFLVATVGAFIGVNIGIGLTGYLFIAIAGLIVLFALRMMINTQGINLFLLFLFTFLEGMGLAPIIAVYLATGYGFILGQAFLLTAGTSLGLSVYAWTTKRSFARLGDYLFFGLILLLVAGIVEFFFQSPLFVMLVAVFGVAIFCGYILYYVQRAKYLADTLPNAIGLTVSLFIAVMNLFLYILEILTIAQGGRRR
ncbi:MAG TPA: Bax inhibitor-1/YccA family protein [Ktedonobacteraceae bacterium]|jgi:FtsH-binding integral membrane protein|nr:Bax inhibitor-1/YccA family protein [Ktedonobacteraceae bacterium]